MFRILWLATFLASIAPDLRAAEKASLRIVLAGDSTVSDFPATEKLRGWGMYLPAHFRPGVTVVNRAVGGRSSKTYLLEGWWGKVLREKADYVLIQFGHNDNHPAGTPEHTEPEEFSDNLRRFIQSARQAGARPILVTPVSARSFLADGHFKDDLERYASAMRKVAEVEEAPLVELNELSGQLYDRLGPSASAQFASAPGDTIHFNDLGAWTMATIVARELRRTDPALARVMVTSPPPAPGTAGRRKR